MSQLELIWELENQNILLDNYKKKLEIVNNNYEIKKMEVRYNDAKSQFNSLKLKLENNKTKLFKYNNTLKEYDFKLLEIEKVLYNGNISDLKQLKHLNNEKDKLNRQIEDIETDILTLMETAEQMEIDLINIEEDLNTITNEITKTNNYYKLLSDELINRIDLEEKEIKEYAKKIEPSLLHRYKVLRKSKGNGIVYVKNYICSGCNMLVPTYIGEKLKAKNEIIYCESCGRMLYFFSEK